VRWLALVPFLALVACSDEAPPADEALAEEEWPEALDEEGRIVRWHARDRWGIERFELERDGSTRYWIDRARAAELRVERTVNATELEALRDRLRELDCCALESDPATAFAYRSSEGLLELRLPGVSCDIHRVLHRWDDGRGARCDDAVRELHGRIRPRGSPPPEEAEEDEGSAAEAPAEEEPADEEEPDEPVGDVPPG
jgi:hypothetical protein